MKRILAICLLTALCFPVLTSCDIEHGLLAELLEQQDEILLPGTDAYEQPSMHEEVLIDPVPPVQSTRLVDAKVNFLREQYPDTVLEHVLDYDLDNINGGKIVVQENIQTLSFGGYIGLAGLDYAKFGYRIQDKDPEFSDAFQADPDPQIKQELYEKGSSYVNGFDIQVDMEYLPVGTYEITLLFNMQGAVVEFCSFEVYKQATESGEEIQPMPPEEIPVP